MPAATAASSASAAALAQGELGWSPMGYTVWTVGPANPRAVMATAMLWLRSIRLAKRRAISRIAICGAPCSMSKESVTGLEQTMEVRNGR